MKSVNEQDNTGASKPRSTNEDCRQCSGTGSVILSGAQDQTHKSFCPACRGTGCRPQDRLTKVMPMGEMDLKK